MGIDKNKLQKNIFITKIDFIKNTIIIFIKSKKILLYFYFIITSKTHYTF